MAVPAKVKTWVVDPNNVIAYASLYQVTRDILHGWKTFLKANGFTVKGSSNGTTAAMDAVDRFVTPATDWNVRGNNATSAQSWIVLEHAGMGGAEILIANQGVADSYTKLAISHSGVFTVAGTPTHQPTAADLIDIHSAISIHSTAVSVQRVWHGWVASDGSSCSFAVAEQGAVTRWVNFATAVPLIAAPSVWDSPVCAWSVNVFTAAALLAAAAIKSSISNGGGYVPVDLFGSTESFANAVNGPSAIGFIQPELQNSGYPLFQIGVWSKTGTTRGKAGTLIDVWAGPAVGHGDTFPDDTSRLWIALGNYVMPWDGSVPVMG